MSVKAARPTRSKFRKVVKGFASLKLAIVIILSIASLAAWGTIVESKYNSQIAQQIVYHSIYMMFAMGALAVCLIAVMIDRWPWKKKHTGFVLAHIGILILMTGAVITRMYGVDGSVAVGFGETTDAVTLNEVDFAVYASLDGDKIRKIFDYSQATGKEAQFFGMDFQKSPLKISIPDGEIKVIDHYPFALRNEKIAASNVETDGPAIRFQLQNANVNVVNWLAQTTKNKRAEQNFGPAKVILAKEEIPFSHENMIVLKPLSNESLNYQVHSAREGKITHTGTIKAGETVETGWMGLKFRLIDFLPNAKQEITFKPLEHPTELTIPAIKIHYKDSDYWLGLNSMVKLFSNQAVYIVSYMNRRVSMGFPITLKDFKVGRYQGTARAATYESLVNVPGVGERKITMNEPLKHNGFTVYQASFSEDEQGKPVASIFSVNRDPGRWIKYLGSLFIVFGSIHMFFFKRKQKMLQTTLSQE